MNESSFDISGYVWLDHESVGSPTSHMGSLELYRDNVVRTSLRAMNTEINNLRQSDDPAAIFFESDLTELFQSSVEGFLISVQSMWERNLRSMLTLREKKLCHGRNVQSIERATWGGKSREIQNHFERLMGLPIEAFDSYQDLDLLQNLGSAIRHGDGRAAKTVHNICPSLWRNWIAPGGENVAEPFRMFAPYDGPTSPPFDAISLPESLLEQMIQSVLWFWEDVENVRCNSFRRKSPSVVEKLSQWQSNRNSRKSKRQWNAK